MGTPRERRAIRETTDAKVYTSERACMGGCVCARMLSHSSRARLCATLWTIAHQTPLFLGFSSQEYWSGLPCPPPGDLPDPGIKPTSLMSPALAGGFFTARRRVCIYVPKPVCANVCAYMCVFHACVHPNAGMFKCACECAYENACVCDHACVCLCKGHTQG